jgi:hypothetical protein
MPKSEHQGLQIALILFVMVTVVLAITTFFFYRSADEASKRAEAADKGKQDATTRANSSDARLEYVLHILGIEKLPEAQVEQLKTSFGADEKMKNVISNFEQHMSTYGAILPKDEQTYADVLPKILMNMRQANVSVVQQNQYATKSKEERDSVQKAEKSRADEALKAQELAQKERDDEKSKYMEDRTRLETQEKTALASYVNNLKVRKDEVAKAKVEVDNAMKEVAKTSAANQDLRDALIQFRDEPFEVPDGQVTWVNQSARLVWINLGLADGLRRQTMFSVYDREDNGVQRADPKASIEVTKVLEQHLAEARISFDRPGNPILLNDPIFSPAWRPGKRTRFALAGLMDIDEDGRSDRNLVRSLLVASGGQIDFEVHDDGKTEGEMKAGIRYLVLGGSPAEREVINVDRKVLEEYSKAQAAAVQLGIEIINIDKMLEWVGYRPEVRARSVGLGEHADPAQFKPRPEEGRSRTATGAIPDQFKKRQPPAKKQVIPALEE